MACATSGTPVELPAVSDRRDGSGVPVSQPILAVAGPAATLPSGHETPAPAVQD
jgi:DNA gyrase subunit A